MKKYWVLCRKCKCVSVPADQARCSECGPAKPSRAGGHGHTARAKYYKVECEPVRARTVYVRDGWRCGICRHRINQSLHYPDPMSASLDHIVPLSLGGGHTYVNTQASHLICNLRKSYAGAGDQLALLG